MYIIYVYITLYLYLRYFCARAPRAWCDLPAVYTIRIGVFQTAGMRTHVEYRGTEIQRYCDIYKDIYTKGALFDLPIRNEALNYWCMRP